MTMNWLRLAAAFMCIYCAFLTVYGTPLYGPMDKIVLLENDTISSAMYNSKYAWFVEFYSSWCGHCQAFAPDWINLAERVEGWNHIIKVAAIDCAEARNTRTCEHFNIQGYPTLKFFKAFTTNLTDLGKVYYGKRKPVHLQQAMVDFLNIGGNSNFKLDFSPLSHKVTEMPFEKNPFVSKPLLLVFEKKASYLGKELMLDLLSNHNISVKRIVDDVYRMGKYGVRKLPQVVLIEKNGNYVHLKSLQTRPKILLELKRYDLTTINLQPSKSIQSANLHFQDLHKNDAPIPQKNKDGLDVNMQDLESALTFIFTREIVIKKSLHKEHLERFVNLLVQCFPGHPRINKFLQELHKWLQPKLQDVDRPLRPSAMRLFYNMYKAENISLPEKVEWRACRGSRPQYRGYPCSLWLLFHTLTVNCANRNVKSLTGADVLTAIRGYVKSFFGCLECSKHFYDMSKNVENEVQTHNEAILWLWRAHNKVNKRLSKEPSSDPHFPKQAYPPKYLCQECASEYSNRKNIWLDSPSTWKDDVVLNYLRAHYGVNNIRVAKTAESSRADADRVSTRIAQVVDLGLTYFDSSLCVVVYGAGVFILALLYMYMLKRRRMHVKHTSHFP